MKIQNELGATIKGICSFKHNGSNISISTKGNFPEIAVFPNDGSNLGPFDNMETALKVADHVAMEATIAKYRGD